jgi:hypothetical protein
MEKYSETQEIEYGRQGICSLDAYADLANHLIDTLKMNEKRTVLISRPRAFKMMFNTVKNKRESKDRYIIQPIPANKKQCAKVIVRMACEM